MVFLAFLPFLTNTIQAGSSGFEPTTYFMPSQMSGASLRVPFLHRYNIINFSSILSVGVVIANTTIPTKKQVVPPGVQWQN